ncbi:MAG: hypothetical protein HKN79_06920 [Flavobacteriales bacterium]|nr:hypothetical protein [Flavobacteriales bacterium]
MEEWWSLHEEKLKIASVVVASLVLLVSIYRWLLQKWRSDVNLRRYAYLYPLDGNVLLRKQSIKVEVPVSQFIELSLTDENGRATELFNGEAPEGMLEVELDMSQMATGDYELKLSTDDQTALKRYAWTASD